MVGHPPGGLLAANYYNNILHFCTSMTSSSLTLTGTNITTAAIDLDIGWNSIGRFNITATAAELLVQDITNCTAVAYWNVTLGRFIIHPINTDIGDFIIERGMGVFVYVKTESSWINQ